jgi:thiamine-monophosphate kinase
MLEDKNLKKTNISAMGEFALVNHLTKSFSILQETTIKGIGDDAAILDFRDKKTVVSTEIFVEGVHFDLGYMPLKHLGYKSIVSGISDICAMNATPSQVLISVAVSNRFSVEALEELFEGFRLASSVYKIDIVGGDTTSSQTGLVINITTLGHSNLNDITSRNTAKEGDLLVVTGDLGAAYMGLQVLEREKQVFQVNPNNQPVLDDYTYLIERQLKPEARTDIKELLEKLEIKPTAMIDVSDGLASDVLHICSQSNLGCTIYEEKIPADPQLIQVCEEFQVDITTIALSGGEDFEILFTISQNDYDKIKHNPNFTIIGHMVSASEGNHLVTRANTKIALKARGWNAIE